MDVSGNARLALMLLSEAYLGKIPHLTYASLV